MTSLQVISGLPKNRFFNIKYKILIIFISLILTSCGVGRSKYPFGSVIIKPKMNCLQVSEVDDGNQVISIIEFEIINNCNYKISLDRYSFFWKFSILDQNGKRPNRFIFSRAMGIGTLSDYISEPNLFQGNNILIEAKSRIKVKLPTRYFNDFEFDKSKTYIVRLEYGEYVDLGIFHGIRYDKITMDSFSFQICD